MFTRIFAAGIAIATIVVTGCDSRTVIPAANAAAYGADTDSLAESHNAQRNACELRIEIPSTIKQRSYQEAKVVIKNVSDAPLTLVMPGDGSDCHWRTPIVGWSFLPHDSKNRHPEEAPRRRVARCGNINRLKPDEVFVLKPGAAREIDEWVHLPHTIAPGKYRVVFYYSNVPDMKWSGIPLGKHDEQAMRRVEGSAPVSLTSNEVQVEIVE